MESLAACFHELDGTKAVGIDGITKAHYGEHLEENLHDLVERINTFVYQATRILFGQLNRRSQRKSFTWEQFERFRKAHPLPPVKLGCALY